MQRTTEQTVLMCKECGEKLVLPGSEEDWCSRQAIFIGECGHKLTLEGHADEEVLIAS